MQDGVHRIQSLKMCIRDRIKARYFDGTIGYKETSINITNVDNKGPNNFIPQITNTTTKEITVKGCLLYTSTSQEELI